MAESASTIYRRVVSITHVYLGPAADRFIDRQIQNHIHKVPADLDRADLAILIDWIRVAVAMLTDDSEIVEEYIAQLERISNPQPTKKQPSRGQP